MRIVIIDLDSNAFLVKNLNQIMSRRFARTQKYDFFLNWLIENKIQVNSYITENGTSIFTSQKNFCHSKVFRTMEHFIVLLINHIPVKSVKIIYDKKEILNTDVVVGFSFYEKNCEAIAKIKKGHKIVNHLHFFGENPKSVILKKANIEIFSAEADMSKLSLLYSDVYGWFKGDFQIWPLHYEKRFKEKTPYADRKNKAIAVGTLGHHLERNFVQVYQTTCFHPRRKMIFDKKDELNNYLDCFITEEKDRSKEILQTDNFFEKFKKKYWNFFKAYNRKKYYSFNMVDTLNQYKIFICPEDIHGMYGVGFMEGMACGCAYIGWEYEGYSDLGLIAGKHYIGYDGSYENLVEKLEYYEKEENQKELEEIAQTGCAFIRENYNSEAAAEKIYRQLESISQRGSKDEE